MTTKADVPCGAKGLGKVGLVVRTALILSVAVGLMGCTIQDSPSTGDDFVRIWTDTTTGCQYVLYMGKGGIVPRLDSDGKPVCGVR